MTRILLFSGLLYGWVAMAAADTSSGACIIKSITHPAALMQPGDPRPAILAQLNGPLATGPSGALYVTMSNKLYKVQAGVLYTIAGLTGAGSSTGDEGPAAGATFTSLQGVAVGPDESIYLFDGPRIRIITPDGVIHAFAGNGLVGFSGDGGPATAARLQGGFNAGLAVDSSGAVYLSDVKNYRIRKVGTDGVIRTIAGVGGGNGPDGDGGPATLAQLSGPGAIGVDLSGRVYFFDGSFGNGRIRMIDTSGVIHAFAGYSAAQGAQPNLVQGSYADLASMTVDNSSGSVFFGNGTIWSVSQDGGAAVPKLKAFSTQMAADPSGALYFGDGSGNLKELLPSGAVQTVAGGNSNGTADGAPAEFVSLDPRGIAADAAGILYLSDQRTRTVQTVGPDGIIHVYAGGGSAEGESIPALSAQLNNPGALAVDQNGNLYVSLFDRVRKITPAGIISTIAGGGTSTVVGGPATGFRFVTISGVAIDGAGGLIVTESGATGHVYRIPADGTIQVVAGGGNSLAEGIAATDARLNSPSNPVAGPDGSIWFTDNAVVWVVTSDGIMRSGTKLSANSIGFDLQSTLYLAQSWNIIRVNADGTVGTLAGGFGKGSQGDGGPPEQALLSGPFFLSFDGLGNLFFIDSGSVREITNVVNCTAPAVPLGTGPTTGAPGMRMTYTGINLGPAKALIGQPDASGFFPFTLGGVQVSVNGLAAPILSAQYSSLTFVVPYQAVSGSVQVQLNGVPSAPVPFTKVEQATKLFLNGTERGSSRSLVYALNEDATVNSESNPAAAGSVVAVYVTGDGETDPPGIDGKAAMDPLPRPVLTPLVQLTALNGQAVLLPRTVETPFYGAVPREIGKTQINVRIPEGTLPGQYYLSVNRVFGVLLVK